jgi:hypothetical protein
MTSPAAAAPAFYAVAVNAANAAAPGATGVANGTIAIGGGLTDTVATDKSAYTLPAKPNQTTWVSITTRVQSGSSTISGASITVKVRDPSGRVTTLAGTTSSAGTATVTYGLKKKGSAAGTYSVTSNATMGAMSASATTAFSVQ